MGLLIIAAGVFFLSTRSKATMALAGAAQSPASQKPIRIIDWPLLAKISLYVEVAIVLALIALSASPVDVAGAVTSGLVVAFIIHLVVSGARRR
jgi:hypothetical protein